MHYWKKKLIGAVSIALSITVFSSIAFAGTGVINGDSVRVRTGKGTNYEVADRLNKNTKVEILESIDGWYKIKYGKKSGWVSESLVTKTEEKSTTYAITKTNRVNIRKGASTEHSVIECLEKGVKLGILEKKGEWYKVKSPKGKIGWVISELVKVSSAVEGVPAIKPVKAEASKKKSTTKTSRSDEARGKGEQIVAYARRFLEVPYMYGGSSPNGFDCSGFVKYVYNSQGIKLNRVAKEQAEQGWSISFEDLRPGDLMFFDPQNHGRISHVGIYIGNNQFIHASSGEKTYKVCISSTKEFYRNKFIDARRFFE